MKLAAPLLLLHLLFPGNLVRADISCRLAPPDCSVRNFGVQVNTAHELYQALRQMRPRTAPTRNGLIQTLQEREDENRLGHSTEALCAGKDPMVPKEVSALPRQVLNLTGTNDDKNCGFFRLLASASQGEDEFRSQLQGTNWNPCCIPSDIKQSLQGFEGNLNGFAVGTEGAGGVSFLKFVGPSASRNVEVVLVRNGTNSVQVAVVENLEASLGVSLPLGAALTQSILQGKCESIENYLGYFKSVTIAGLRVMNQGMSGGPYDLSAKRTDCDTQSTITGLSTPLVSIGGSYARLATKVYELHGDRVKGLLKMMDDVSSDAAGRRLAKELGDPGMEDPLTRQSLGQPSYRASDVTSPTCDDSIWSQLEDGLKSR